MKFFRLTSGQGRETATKPDGSIKRRLCYSFGYELYRLSLTVGALFCLHGYCKQGSILLWRHPVRFCFLVHSPVVLVCAASADTDTDTRAATNALLVMLPSSSGQGELARRRAALDTLRREVVRTAAWPVFLGQATGIISIAVGVPLLSRLLRCY